MKDQARFDAEQNITTLGHARVVFHCHHYNVFLQRTVDEALGDDGIAVQRAAAAESARHMLQDLFANDGSATPRARLERAAALFGSLGFGQAEVSALTPYGGTVVLRTSHYAIGWRSRFGASAKPVCHFAAGFWAGALAAAVGLAPERVAAHERCCAARDEQDQGCEIVIEVR
jgi:predicted hydrocarbon binding protein